MLKNKKIKNIVNKFSYDKKNLKLLKNNLNTNFEFFLENMIFIKTTGRHFFKGHLLTKNDFIKKNTINNKNIFLIIKKYFNN